MEQHRCYGCMAWIEEETCPHCGYSGKENESHQLPVGTLLRGQYRLGRVLGQGGFGITYLGYDESLEEIIAVKEFYPISMVSRDTRISREVSVSYSKLTQHYEEGRSRFLREAKALSKLRDIPEIVHIRDFFEENGTAYIAMEFVRGQELGDYVLGQGGTLPLKKVLSLLEPLFAALEQVHKAGIVHRDISPDNIMLLPGGAVKIIDFGASREFTAAHADKDLTASTEAILKHGYAPIEQYRTHGGLGPWTDLYALCGVIHYCLTGQVPPDAPAIAMGEESMLWKKIRGLTTQQLEALKKASAVKASDRYQNIGEFYRALTSGAPAPKKKPRYLPWLLGGAALIVAVVLLVLLLPRPAAPEETQAASQPTPTQTEAQLEVTTEPPAEEVTVPPTTQPPVMQPVMQWQENVLCASPMDTLCDQTVYFEGGEPMDNKMMVTTVTFLDTLEGAPETAVDLSDQADGKVLGWLDGTNAYIAAEGGVNGKLACEKLFAECASLQTVSFGGNFHTEQAESMAYMFAGCASLETLDAQLLDTSAVKTMEHMFGACSKLRIMDVSGWDTGSVTTMKGMFSLCSVLHNLDVSMWDTWNVTDMSQMFFFCYTLEELAVGRWDTGGVEDMTAMFAMCYNLKQLDVRTWDTSSVTSMKDMFNQCFVIERLDVGQWDVSAVTDMHAMFQDCSELRTLAVVDWDISNVTDISYMFSGCHQYLSDVYRWDYSSVVNYECFLEPWEVIQGEPWEEYIKSGYWREYQYA